MRRGGKVGETEVYIPYSNTLQIIDYVDCESVRDLCLASVRGVNHVLSIVFEIVVFSCRICCVDLQIISDVNTRTIVYASFRGTNRGKHVQRFGQESGVLICNPTESISFKNTLSLCLSSMSDSK